MLNLSQEEGGPYAAQPGSGFIDVRNHEDKGLGTFVAEYVDGSAAAKEHAAAALWILSVNTANKVAIVAAGALAPLEQLLRDGSEAVKKMAAGALKSLGQ